MTAVSSLTRLPVEIEPGTKQLGIGGRSVELTLSKAKARLSELVAAAQRGERVVITKHGKPAVELVRFRESGGIDFDKLNAARRRLGIESASREWPAEFDDPAFSRRVLKLESGSQRS